MQYFLGDTGWCPYTQPTFRHVNITGNTTLQNIPIGSYVLKVSVNNTFTYATLVFNVTDADPNAISPFTINQTQTEPTRTPNQTTIAATNTPSTSKPSASPNPLPSNSPADSAASSTLAPSQPPPQMPSEPKETTSPFLQPVYLAAFITCAAIAVAAFAVALKRIRQTPNKQGSTV
jgi:hypothetical protein